MIDQKLLLKLTSIVGTEHITTNEPMSLHTTFRIGGNADVFLTPVSVDQIKEVVSLLSGEHAPFYVMGNGSNLLVSDQGYRGAIIHLCEQFSSYEFVNQMEGSAVDKNNQVYVRAQAGIKLEKLGKELAGYSLSGFEFATGIPGTVGGAVMMNAGAYGGEMKDILVSATVMDAAGRISQLDAKHMELGYRTSIVAKQNLIVLDAVFALKPGNQEEITRKIDDLWQRRVDKQPLEYPSAGSTFKRPTGFFAGKLITDAGLKGYQVGGAQVSNKHAGFVINTGNATAKDVLDLVQVVQEKVYEQNGVHLEMEVKKLGFDS